MGDTGGFTLVMRSGYLRLIALLLILLNVVNTTGEYILSATVVQAAEAAAAADKEESCPENRIPCSSSSLFWRA